MVASDAEGDGVASVPGRVATTPPISEEAGTTQIAVPNWFELGVGRKLPYCFELGTSTPPTCTAKNFPSGDQTTGTSLTGQYSAAVRVPSRWTPPLRMSRSSHGLPGFPATTILVPSGDSECISAPGGSGLTDAVPARSWSMSIQLQNEAWSGDPSSTIVFPCCR